MKILLGCSTFLGVLFALFLLYAGLNYSGFCFAQMRYLSDEERFRKIFFDRINRGGTFVSEGQGYEKVKYESFEQYMESNSDCCAIVPYHRAYNGFTFLERITGYGSGELTVMSFTVYSLDKNGERISPQELKLKIGQKNCGQELYLR
ncbi:MAG: hypothetical protein F6K17_26260 [Okeania sp. SIO3C4]|nr:hypothetical protein [Okeania sp. SIO3C4]